MMLKGRKLIKHTHPRLTDFLHRKGKEKQQQHPTFPEFPGNDFQGERLGLGLRLSEGKSL